MKGNDLKKCKSTKGNDMTEPTQARKAPTQKDLDRWQNMLRELINAGPELRDYCCGSSQLNSRDALSEAVGHLMIAESKIGQLVIKTPEGVIATRDGGGGAGGK